MSYRRNGGKLHGNISRNGYGNAMIGRYGGCFEEGVWWVYDTGEKCVVLERLAMVEERKVRIINGLNISQKNSYTYCKNFISPRSKVLLRMLLGGRLVGVNHRAPPTSTQGKAIKRALYAINLLHNFHHMCMLRDLLTSTQALFKFIITQLAWL